jgi:hypothetical protein
MLVAIFETQVFGDKAEANSGQKPKHKYVGIRESTNFN